MKNEKDSNKADFYQRVYQVVRKIPYARVTSYGYIARYLGSPQSSRMVGWALNNSHSQTEWVPAHRVVNRNGLLTGKSHFNGCNVMQDLLESEGIEVNNDEILHFKEVLWDPSKELVINS
jgi:methylated-DNA-protein-cysteine methyltransferase-like protein